MYSFSTSRIVSSCTVEQKSRQTRMPALMQTLYWIGDFVALRRSHLKSVQGANLFQPFGAHDRSLSASRYCKGQKLNVSSSPATL